MGNKSQRPVGVPPGIGADGQVVDKSVLEHLDLSIHFVNNQLETDVFAKDIPIQKILPPTPGIPSCCQICWLEAANKLFT